jgi:hypothetical protein
MTKISSNIIDLNTYRAAGSKVFTGRDRGEQDRELSKIDSLINQFDKVRLLIPNDIYSINPSYLEEFLVNVVEKLGKEGFYQKFEIVNEGAYKIDSDLNEAIDRILREDHALI